MNKGLKNWAILATTYCHDLKLHQTVCVAVILLLQLSFEYNPLFSVEYYDLTWTVTPCKYFYRSY
jgi:hypothetical protein